MKMSALSVFSPAGNPRQVAKRQLHITREGPSSGQLSVTGNAGAHRFFPPVGTALAAKAPRVRFCCEGTPAVTSSPYPSLHPRAGDWPAQESQGNISTLVHLTLVPDPLPLPGNDPAFHRPSHLRAIHGTVIGNLEDYK
ncbi:hypothetical protein HJG60_010378 [Phyllostomus discolor]|uniref:Uncharacterized protein n=1 Tax=Phyllostomus discolor TaxID=89673 RepID=A0A834EMX5_9CHIR|nr:hypothetical protein HJG60_010378 [Phyllostomus discolor]